MSPDVSRRTIAKGAAWSVPAIALASAAPAAAASPCTDPTAETRTVRPTVLDSPTSGPWGREEFMVPDGVTEIQFEVLGGGGGGPSGIATGRGGHGHLITGTLAVTPGATITMVAGNGGTRAAGWNKGALSGGQGYGNGGHTPAPSGPWSVTGATGGGGSAILVNGEPAVIAGGGGGAPAYVYNPPTGWTFSPGPGGNAVTNGGDSSIARPGVLGAETAQGGGGANGATPGQPRGANGSNGTTTNGWRRIIGAAGGAPETGANGGADGARGVLGRPFTYYTGAHQVSSAGGGGGYAGGASGTTLARIYDVRSDNQGDYIYNISGTGGGGSSFIDEAMVLASTTAMGTNGGTIGSDLRSPGSVTVSYEAPCEPPPA